MGAGGVRLDDVVCTLDTPPKEETGRTVEVCISAPVMTPSVICHPAKALHHHRDVVHFFMFGIMLL